jgi:hypothetical protein
MLARCAHFCGHLQFSLIALFTTFVAASGRRHNSRPVPLQTTHSHHFDDVGAAWNLEHEAAGSPCSLFLFCWLDLLGSLVLFWCGCNGIFYMEETLTSARPPARGVRNFVSIFDFFVVFEVRNFVFRFSKKASKNSKKCTLDYIIYSRRLADREKNIFAHG